MHVVIWTLPPTERVLDRCYAQLHVAKNTSSQEVQEAHISHVAAYPPDVFARRQSFLFCQYARATKQ
jgi:hypothetical protein